MNCTKLFLGKEAVAPAHEKSHDADREAADAQKTI